MTNNRSYQTNRALSLILQPSPRNRIVITTRLLRGPRRSRILLRYFRRQSRHRQMILARPHRIHYTARRSPILLAFSRNFRRTNRRAYYRQPMLHQHLFQGNLRHLHSIIRKPARSHYVRAQPRIRRHLINSISKAVRNTLLSPTNINSRSRRRPPNSRPRSLRIPRATTNRYKMLRRDSLINRLYRGPRNTLRSIIRVSHAIRRLISHATFNQKRQLSLHGTISRRPMALIHKSSPNTNIKNGSMTLFLRRHRIIARHNQASTRIITFYRRLKARKLANNRMILRSHPRRLGLTIIRTRLSALIQTIDAPGL